MSRAKFKKACPPLTGEGALRGYVINKDALGPVATVLAILDAANEVQRGDIMSILYR